MKQQRLSIYFYLLVLILPNIVINFTEQLTVANRISLVFLPLSIYCLLFSYVRRTGVMFLSLFPILFLGAFQLVLLYIFGAGCISVDMWLNLVTTNSSEVNHLLSQLLPAIIAVVVIYVPSIVYAIVVVYKKETLDRQNRVKLRGISGILLFIGLVALGTDYADQDYRAEHNLFPLNAINNCKLAIDRQIATNNYVEDVADFKFGAVDGNEKDSSRVVVMVVGETSRASNWSLYGYSRSTNPLLSKEPRLLIYRDCISQSNTTHKSVPIMLSPASAENFDQLYHAKGISAAFREAGYYTAFYSNQQRNGSFIDFFGAESNEQIYAGDKNAINGYDGVLLSYLDRVIKERKGKLFVILHTYGSHFNYSERYPKSFSYFKPDSDCNAKESNREALINAYDNSIRYTDYFLSQIISKLGETKRSTAMLYLSDHGEDIFDDRRSLFLHASPQPTYYQLHVPFLVWTSKEYGKANPVKQQNLLNHRDLPIGSDCVFHTLLGLGDIKTRLSNDTLSLTNSLFYPKTRHYINDHNEPMTFDRCFGDLDKEMLKRNNLRNE